MNVGEKQSAVQEFVKENNYTMTVLLDPDGTARRAYGVRALPTNYVVDSQGIVSYFQRGYGSALKAKLREEIESALP